MDKTIMDALKQIRDNAYNWERDAIRGVAEQALAAANAEQVARVHSKWKSGNEYAPYHPSASHVNPDYRDGWNACYQAGANAAEAKPEQIEAWMVPTLISFKGARTSCPEELQPELEGTVAWHPEVYCDDDPVTDKFGVEHRPYPLTRYTALPAPVDAQPEEALVEIVTGCITRHLETPLVPGRVIAAAREIVGKYCNQTAQPVAGVVSEREADAAHKKCPACGEGQLRETLVSECDTCGIELSDPFFGRNQDAERCAYLKTLDGGSIYALLGDYDGIHEEYFDGKIDAAITAKQSDN